MKPSKLAREIGSLLTFDQAFENTSTSVAASQMRNALNQLADTVKDPKEKQVSRHFPPMGHDTASDDFAALRD